MNVRILAGMGIGIVLVAYAAIVRPVEGRLADRYRALDERRNELAGATIAQQRLADVERERARLTATLAALRLDGEAATVVARFLDAATTAAQRHGASIRAIEAQPAVRAGDAPATAFDELPLRLTLGGTYRAVVGTLREIIGAPIASRLSLEALTADEAARERPLVLSAVVRVSLLLLPESAGVRTRAR